MQMPADITVTPTADANSALAVSVDVIEELTNELKKKGVVRLPSLLSAQQLEAMQSGFRARLGRMRCNNIDGYEKELYRHVVQDVLAVEQGFVDIGLHPIVKEVLRRYLGESFALVETKGWRSLPTKRDFHGWHGDAWYDENVAIGMPYEVKLAFYLTDVTSGAFNYIRGTHRINHPRLVRNAEISKYSPADIDALTGPAGTAFLFDTSGIHRQSVPILDEREAVFYNYHDPTVKLQNEAEDYYRYHPLILNAAFLGNLTKEDARILGLGNKVRYQPLPAPRDAHPRLHKVISNAYWLTLSVEDLHERLRSRLLRLIGRNA
jgi:Phytanoyl-CoA dioxygenase (PhyH)